MTLGTPQKPIKKKTIFSNIWRFWPKYSHFNEKSNTLIRVIFDVPRDKWTAWCQNIKIIRSLTVMLQIIFVQNRKKTTWRSSQNYHFLVLSVKSYLFLQSYSDTHYQNIFFCEFYQVFLIFLWRSMDSWLKWKW